MINKPVRFAIIVALIVFGWLGYLFISVQAQDQIIPLEQTSVYDKRLDEIGKEAIEQAYRARVIDLFEIWMRDPEGQPERATIGVRRARNAYISAMTELDRHQK